MITGLVIVCMLVLFLALALLVKFMVRCPGYRRSSHPKSTYVGPERRAAETSNSNRSHLNKVT